MTRSNDDDDDTSCFIFGRLPFANEAKINHQLVQRGRSNIVDGHLKGALTIMVSNPEPSDPTAIFLERVSLVS